MSEVRNSNRPIARRVPDRKFVVPRAGKVNYPWSVLDAPVLQIGETGVEPPVLVGDDFLNLALFTSDVPVLLRASTRWPSAYFGAVEVPKSTYENIPRLVPSIAGAGMSSVAPVLPGEQSSVSVTLAGIAVPAYVAQVEIADLDLTVAPEGGGASKISYLQVSAVCESGVLAGSPTFLGNGAQLIPIILRASQYTQAIRDNKNRFPDGPITYTVVGLWDVPST